MDPSLHSTESEVIASAAVNRALRFGIIVTDSHGSVIDATEEARQIVDGGNGDWPEATSCCSLFGCLQREPLGDHCISALAAESPEPLPEVRVDLPLHQPLRAVWISAARIKPDGSQVALHLRPAAIGDRRRRTQPHWMEAPRLRIRALGRTRVETQEIAIEGDWLLQRPGQLLKYLVCHRRRPAHVDEIVEALWPAAGVQGRNTLRHYVHVLRERLEPSRPPRSPSSFVVSIGSTYSLDRRVVVDLDEFEDLVSAGLSGAPNGGPRGDSSPTDLLEKAIEMYEGDVFSEEPFAEWAFAEREAMRRLADEALNHLIDHYVMEGDWPTATSKLEQAAELRPLDASLQRQLIGLYLKQGRHSDASRRFSNLRQRMQEEFGQEPSFSLADLAAAEGAWEARE